MTLGREMPRGNTYSPRRLWRRSLIVLAVVLLGVILLAAASTGGLVLALGIASLAVTAVVGIVVASAVTGLVRWARGQKGTALSRAPATPLSEPSLASWRVIPQDLLSVDIFRGLSVQHVAQVASIARLTRFPEGSLLAKHGERGDTLYIIREGQVQLTTPTLQGEVTVRIAGPGETLPLASLLGDGRLITNAYAMGEVQAVAIPCSAFLDLCQRHPEIGLHVYRFVAASLGGRYGNTLTRLAGTLDQALREADVFANM